MLPKVTIIVPAFNAGKYIRQAINSIIEQTFLDWEAVVIDDGSTDDTPIVLNAYRDHPKFRIYHQDNSGIPATVNRGIRLSQGEYLCKLDADDYWDPQLLETLVPVMDESPDAGIVYCDSRKINDEGYITTQRMVGFNNIMSNCPVADLLFGLYFPENTFLYRKKAFTDIGEYDLNFAVGSVYDVFLRIASKFSLKYVNVNMGYYRTHPGCVTGDKGRLIENFALIIKKNTPLFKKAGIEDHVIEKAISLCRPMPDGQFDCAHEDLMARLMVYSKFFYLKNHLLPELKEVCIYGAGAAGRLSPEAAGYFGIKVHKIFDSSREKKGRDISGIKVCHSDQIRLGEQPIILVMSEHADEIARCLEAKSLKQPTDFLKMF